MDNDFGISRNLAQYGDAEFSGFLRKAFIKALGYTDAALGAPIIGIVDTRSGYNACHNNIPDLVEAASRGVMLGGGIPVPFPVVSIHEAFSHPTSMYLRNLMAMDVEEMIRAQPMDAVILLGGCDKTVPALLMGAVERERRRSCWSPGRCSPAAGAANGWAPAPIADASGRATGPAKSARPRFGRPMANSPRRSEPVR